jgi:hypothetical protein
MPYLTKSPTGQARQASRAEWTGRAMNWYKNHDEKYKDPKMNSRGNKIK